MKHNIDRQSKHTSNTQYGHPEPLPLEENRRGAVPHALESHYEKPNGKHIQGEKRFQTQTPSTYTLVAVLTLCSFQLLLQVHLPQASPIGLHRREPPIPRTATTQG